MVNAIIFDWKRTLYDPEKRELIDGSRDVLTTLGTEGLDLYLVGKDPDSTMRGEVIRLEVARWFTSIHFVTGSKSDEDFYQFIREPSQTVVVGDRVRSEIEVGNRIGAITVHIAAGKFADERPLSPGQVPDYSVHNINELPGLIEKL